MSWNIIIDRWIVDGERLDVEETPDVDETLDVEESPDVEETLDVDESPDVEETLDIEETLDVKESLRGGEISADDDGTVCGAYAPPHRLMVLCITQPLP